MPKQILLVDDSVTIQRVVELTFAHKADTRSPPRRAPTKDSPRRATSSPISCSPTRMTGKSGYDLCASLRARRRAGAVPVLILTGNFAPYDEARGTKAGADGYVVKPFETQALIDKVTDAINKRRARPARVPPRRRRSSRPTAGRKDDSLEISIEGGRRVPTPVPATRPAAPPPPAPPPPAAKPATSAPQARTMMGIPAPTVTPPADAAQPPPPPKPRRRPPVAAAMPPPSRGIRRPRRRRRRWPAPAPRGRPAAAAAMPRVGAADAARADDPGRADADAAGRRAPDAPKAPPPRATLMGIPTVNPANLPPGAVALPPSGPSRPRRGRRRRGSHAPTPAAAPTPPPPAPPPRRRSSAAHASTSAPSPIAPSPK